MVRGDISVEFLNKELNNPNTTHQSREVIAAVLHECSNSGRNAVQHLPYSNDIHPHNLVKNHQLFNKNMGPEGELSEFTL